MKPWTLLDETTTPDGRRLTLHERDGEYVIRIGGAELMSTRQHASEEALAETVCRKIAGKTTPSLLVGGLGFGFTLRAALSSLGNDARVVVAEILPAVVAWNRNPNYRLSCDALADPRVSVVEQDVLATMRRSPSAFDGILLDVDNGPTALTTSGNAELYTDEGLRAAKAALRPGGIVAYWSVGDDPPFARRLARAGLTVSVQHARARGAAGGRHTLFIGSLEST